MNEIETLFIPDYVFHFLMVLVALCGILILAAKVVEAVRVFKKPKKNENETLADRQETCERRFTNDKRLLDEHDKRLIALEDGSRVQCAALHALLEHAIHNGNTNEMKQASEDLFDHLNGKK